MTDREPSRSSRRPWGRRGALVLAAVPLLLTGCGSTVPAVEARPDGLGPVPSSSAAGSADLAGPTAGLPGRTGTSGPAQAGGTGTTGGSPAGPIAGRAPTGTGTPALSGRGFDSQRIVLGYTSSRDANKGLQALGFDVGVGDTDAQVRAIVNDLNSHGGIAGRRIELVNHDFSFANYTRDEDTESQRACATFTEDRPVFAVLNTIGLGNAILATCLAKKDIPYADNRFSRGRDPATNPQYSRSLYKPSSMNIDTYVPLFVNGLLRQGFFTGWDTTAGGPGTAPVKVGTMHFSTPEWTYYLDSVKKRLAAAGHPVVKTVTYPVGVDNVVAASTNAVVQFRQAGITHVINANIAFIQAAENQGYRPRYSVDEGVAPQALTELAPQRQLHGSMGVGYNPYNDVEAGSDPQSMRRPAQLACQAVMRKAGLDTSSQTVLQAMMFECDLFNFMARSLRGATSVGTDALAAGVNALGTAYESTITFGVHFDARHHAGAVAARNLAYVDPCTCYRYTSPPFRR
jgi:hypothetical protein